MHQCLFEGCNDTRYETEIATLRSTILCRGVIRENRDTPRDYLSNHVMPACKSWASCTQIFPSRTSRACSLPKQKTQRLCVSSQITRIHTLLERLASARHDNKGKLYSYQNARFFKQTSQWRRRRGWCILPTVLILWSRRPTDGVFTYVSSDTSHAEGVPP